MPLHKSIGFSEDHVEEVADVVNIHSACASTFEPRTEPSGELRVTSHELLFPSATSHEVIGNAVCLAHVDDVHFDKIPIETEPNIRAVNEMINQLLLDANTIFVTV